jgi:hypothetical protein
MRNELSIIVTLRDSDIPKRIEFYDIFKCKDSIKSLIYLYDFNSYLVNIDEGFFCINGGRRIKPCNCDSYEDRQLIYAKRNAKDINVNSGEESELRINYLLGVKGRFENEYKTVLLQISEDGSSWIWRDKK